MLNSPLENSAIFNLGWLQARPRVTQKFGNDFTINGKWVYREMGLEGHNGIDFGCPIGTKVFAPMSGYIKVKNSGNGGYGLHVRIRSPFRGLEIVLGHLSEVKVSDSQIINAGDLIGYSGNTGFSTGDHIHLGVRSIKAPNNAKLHDSSVWDWPVMGYDNGYYGYWDCLDFLIAFKGTLVKNSL